jgi:hypothetical protein
MIGTRPMFDLAPLDYRYALDAAMSLVGAELTPAVLCQVPELAAEIGQRLPAQRADIRAAGAALWIEPLAGSWQADLALLAQALPHRAVLVIVASRPLARLVPERRAWGAQPLGLRLGGIAQLQRELRRAGFALAANYGLHSGLAIVLSRLGQQIERLGRPDLGDRLQFEARLRYCTGGWLAALATVGLLVAKKEHS